MNKGNNRYTVVFSILVQILIKDSASVYLYLSPTECIDCSLMRVLKSLGHKDFTIITGNAFFK